MEDLRRSEEVRRAEGERAAKRLQEVSEQESSARAAVEERLSEAATRRVAMAARKLVLVRRMR